MKDRCYNPNGAGYNYYGGRGIQVCPKWKDNLTAEEAVNFITKRIINPNKPIAESGNKNTYMYNGVGYTVGGLAKLSGLPPSVISDRLISGMSVEKAVTAPLRQVEKFVYKGKEYTATELTGLLNISRHVLRLIN